MGTTFLFDMRAPDWGTPTNTLYRAALEMAAYADKIGVDVIGVMEHHGSEDGYLPQPFLMASALAAVTKRIRLSLGAVILPLHDPVEIAEQIAIADLISDGRVSIVLGAGYVPSEFAMFGKSMRGRGAAMDRGIEVILRALNGERFEHDGRPVFIRPLPVQKPEEILMVGGMVPATAVRAARFDLGYGPTVPGLIDLYKAECAKHGREPRSYFEPVPGMPMGIHLCEDPDEGWRAIQRHAVHVITEYAKWADQEGKQSKSPFAGFSDPEVLREAGLFAAWTPEQLLAKARTMPGGGNFAFQPLLGGLDPAEGWKSIRLLEQVMPELKGLVESAREP